ncbi:MAG TPA: zinc finger domain-containing protein, partial [Euzebyales bacterium]|nr:zinc finger domain-containing protein [Euzebyales bacterium]
GSDALDVDRDTFRAALARRSRMVKSALMDQEVVAGLGNLTVDEVLWHACVHPRMRLDALDDRARDRVYEAMRDVLAESVRHGRVPAREGWLTGSREDVQPTCPRCGAPIEQGVVNSRGTYWCPRCQQL